MGCRSRRSGSAEPSGEPGGGGVRILRFGDGPNDDDPARTRSQHLLQVGVVDAADGEPGAGRPRVGELADRAEGGVRPARFGRCRPNRSEAEIVDSVEACGSRGLGQAVAAESDDHFLTDHAAGRRGREVALTQMQHVRPGGQRNVGAIVDSQQLSVAAGGVGEHRKQVQFVGGFEILLPQLNDVDAPGENRVQEFG